MKLMTGGAMRTTFEVLAVYQSIPMHTLRLCWLYTVVGGATWVVHNKTSFPLWFLKVYMVQSNNRGVPFSVPPRWTLLFQCVPRIYIHNPLLIRHIGRYPRTNCTFRVTIEIRFQERRNHSRTPLFDT